MLLGILYFLFILSFRKSDGHYEHLRKQGEQNGPFGARRILRGSDARSTRPYMVYLRPAPQSKVPIVGRLPAIDPNWLCGGVIIDPMYILTSAACIEDMQYFYVVSGTHKWLPASETNECIENGATRAVWKCVPKSYNYDAKALNNILWMVNDIAVVMVADRFNFEKRVIGCDFIPQLVSINNISQDLEKPGTTASVAGWGSTESFSDGSVPEGSQRNPIAVTRISVVCHKAVPFKPADFIPMERTSLNSPDLQEADVMMIEKTSCKNQWLAHYHDIIDKNMICGMDIGFTDMSEACEQGELTCRHIYYEGEVKDSTSARRKKISHGELLKSLARLKKKRKARRNKAQRRLSNEIGGVCENDHGGPLTVGAGRTTTVVGIITAYRTTNHSKKCMGPFLYTSVWKNRHFIHCAVYKEKGSTCRRMLRTSSTILDSDNIEWKENEKSNNIGWEENEKRPKPKRRIKKKKPRAQRKERIDLINITPGMS